MQLCIHTMELEGESFKTNNLLFKVGIGIHNILTLKTSWSEETYLLTRKKDMQFLFRLMGAFKCVFSLKFVL